MKKLFETIRKQIEDKALSVHKDTPTLKCKTCFDSGILDHSVFFEGYGTTKAFCGCEKGKELFKKWTEEPKQVESYKQHKTSKIECLLEKSKVGIRFKSKKFEDLKDNPKLLEICSNYVNDFRKMKENGWGLFFRGNIGSGKTHAASAICNELIEKHFTEILFVNMSDVSNRVKLSFDASSKSSDGDLFETMKKVEMLVIDDIGVEKVTEWLSEQLFLVINFRYEHNKPMIVTSNQSLEDLGNTHKPQIASRLDEMCKSIKFIGSDRRIKKRPAF